MLYSRGRFGRRRGLALVEFALLLPVLMTLLVGAWEAGRLIEINQILSNATREGARQASAGQATSSQVQQTVLNYMKNAGLPTTNAVVTVSDLTNSGDPSNATQLDHLQVSVSIPFKDVRWSTLTLVTSPTTQVSAQSVWLSVKDQNYPTVTTSPNGN
jgi:Flp pilus assembly protein TadG